MEFHRTAFCVGVPTDLFVDCGYEFRTGHLVRAPSMKKYYRAVARSAFFWVDTPDEATAHSREAAEATQRMLKEFGLETELEERLDPKLMSSQYVISRIVSKPLSPIG